MCWKLLKYWRFVEGYWYLHENLSLQHSWNDEVYEIMLVLFATGYFSSNSWFGRKDHAGLYTAALMLASDVDFLSDIGDFMYDAYLQPCLEYCSLIKDFLFTCFFTCLSFTCFTFQIDWLVSAWLQPWPLIGLYITLLIEPRYGDHGFAGFSSCQIFSWSFKSWK